MKKICGLAQVQKITAMEGPTQDVRVTDGDHTVVLHLSGNSYPAGLTPQEARYIAKCLRESADRVESAPGN